MIEAKRTKGCAYHTAYHIVWVPKYRKSILVGKVAKRLETLYVGTAENVSAETIRRYIEECQGKQKER